MYDDPEWRSQSATYRQQHPLCECELHRGREGSPPSTMVDHVIPHGGDRALFWAKTNWRALAKPCHQSKTARLDRDDSNRYNDGNFTETRSGPRQFGDR